MKFDKFFDTYEKHAAVQKKAAEKVTGSIPDGKYEKVLEIGCGTGILTRSLLNRFSPEVLHLNDYFDTREFLGDVTYDEFIRGDMDLLQFQKYDLVISSSVFQWSHNLESLIKKLSESSSHLFFSIYTEGNLKEIESHFGVSLNYYTSREIEKILKKYYENVEYEEEEVILHFDTPMEALRHLKYTGVTGFSKNSSVEKVRNFSEMKLTYVVGYYRCR